MHLQALCNDVLNGHARTQASIRVLKNNLHATSQVSQFLRFSTLNTLAIEIDCAIAGNQPQYGKRERCFSGTGLTNYPDRFSFFHLDSQLFHCFHMINCSSENTALDWKPHSQRLGFQYHFCIALRLAGPAAGFSCQ